MHPAANNYVRDASIHANGGGRAVEFGAYDVNGNARVYFPDHVFYGIDMRLGPNVDEIVDARDFDGGEQYDLVLSTEMLEHASRPWDVIASAHRALRPGGLLILTAAAPERAPHCNNGGHVVPPKEHYEGIKPEELRGWFAEGWEVLSLEHSPGDGDVYVTARKQPA